MKIVVPQAVKTHILTGFLGAGKTTLLQRLLEQKPQGETWAVLMNEFGQIGVDQQLLPQTEGYQIRELLGGCLCCTSQLPMQIALSRLIQETKPQRLFIEPTGLGHPAQLVEQLTEPHWAAMIDMRAVVTVIDGSRLAESGIQQQQIYQDQLKAAEIVVVSHQQEMQPRDQQRLQQLQEQYLPYVQHWLKVDHGQLDLAAIDLAHQPIQRKIQPLLKVQQNMPAGEPLPVIKQLPYHYIERAQGYIVAGWKFPKSWQFDFYQVLDSLCELKGWSRIKAILHTSQGWQSFNFNPNQLNYKSAQENIDNRIEIISQVELDWPAIETQLLDGKIHQSEH